MAAAARDLDTVSFTELSAIMLRLMEVMVQLIEVLAARGLAIDDELAPLISGAARVHQRLGVMPHHRSVGSTTLRSVTHVASSAATPSVRP